MSSCTGFNITSLSLSDTFNTWFERTNEMIGSINAIELLDIQVYQETDNSFRGLKVLPGVANSCFKQLQLIDGPFVGFVTGNSDSNNYGDGTTSNPYKLSLRFSGGESAFSDCSSGDTITGDDYVPVSDTSRNGLFRKAPVKSFVREFVGGNNIQVTFDCNTNKYTITYVELTFNPTFTINSSTIYEPGPDGSAFNNQQMTFTIGKASGSNVSPSVSQITNDQSNRVGGFSTIVINATGNSSRNLTLPNGMYGPSNWFTAGQKITFTASITSANQSDTGIPFTPTNVTRTQSISFGWRFGGLASTSLITDASSLEVAGLTAMQIRDNPSINPWSASNGSSYLYEYPNTTRYFQINVASNNSYLYFVHSSSDLTGSSDRFGWSPTFLTKEGLVVQNGLVEVGGTQLTTNSSRRYRVWRSAQTYNATNPGQPLVFGIS